MESWAASIASRRARSSALALLLGALPAGCVSSKAPPEELPFYSTPDCTAEWVADGTARRKLHRVAPFSFTDQDGREVTNASLRGKIYVADFFFTSCPSICPRMTASFKRIQDAFADDADVELVSHTVDPSTDTPSRLSAYGKEHGVIGRKWHLVTGDQAAVYALARTSYFAEKQLGLSKRADEFLHTENMLLVDRNGHLRGVYNATLAAEASRVIEDIRALKAERSAE
jgi:protein SCO1/2